MGIYKLGDMLLNPTEYPWGFALNWEIKYISPLDSSTLGWSGNGYNDTSGESGSCSGLKTFEEALQYAYDQGGRLPTLDELVNNAVAGTGCNYDSKICWSCDKGEDSSEHWCAEGKDGSGTEELRSNTNTAYVRFVADNDLNRPDPVVLDDMVIYKWLKNQ